MASQAWSLVPAVAGIMVGASVRRTPATAVASRSQVTVGQVRVPLGSAHPTSRRGPLVGRNAPCLPERREDFRSTTVCAVGRCGARKPLPTGASPRGLPPAHRQRERAARGQPAPRAPRPTVQRLAHARPRVLPARRRDRRCVHRGPALSVARPHRRHRDAPARATGPRAAARARASGCSSSSSRDCERLTLRLAASADYDPPLRRVLRRSRPLTPALRVR